MDKVSIIGVDLAKKSFQLHGAYADGSVAFRRKASREKVLVFLAAQPSCLVAMEACAGAHHWAREIAKLGHEVRLIPPIYVKPYVKRQKNDAADAEAIAEAASRPTMRFVAVKTPEQQAESMIFRTRDLMVRQRTQVINALRSHLAEHGHIAPQGLASVRRLHDILVDAKASLPEEVRSLGIMLLEQIEWLDNRIGALAQKIRRRAAQNEEIARLMTLPGVGPISAMAVHAYAPPLETFKSGRHFAAWLGLVPKQMSTGGRPKLGRVSRMGQRDIRRLLVIGAMGIVRWAVHKGPPAGSWLERMMLRKPRILVAMALANKMARMLWAMATKKEDFRGSAVVA